MWTMFVPPAVHAVSPDVMLSMICWCITSPSDTVPVLVPPSSRDDSGMPSQSTAEWPVIVTHPTLTCTMYPSL